MDEDIKTRLDEQDFMLQKIYTSTEKTRKIFFWTMIISLLMIILPLIALAFAIPSVLSLYSTQLSEL